MPDDLPVMAERHGRLLGLVAELSASLAQQLHADAMAAETPEARVKAAGAFHKAARSVRQTLAVEMRLLRERRQLAREERDQAEHARRLRSHDRRTYVHAAVTRLIWNKHEKPEAEEIEAELDERIDERAVLDDDFLTAPVEVIIARVAAELGLAPAALEALLDRAAPVATPLAGPAADSS